MTVAPDAGPLHEPGADPDERLMRTIEAVRRRSRRHDTLGPKAARTRRALLDAAREVFAEKGFVATTTVDVTERAGTSLATFYQYFADISAMVGVLAGEQVVTMLENRVDDWDPRTGRLGLRRLIAAFVHGYFANAGFYLLWEQASVTDPAVGGLRREWWSAYKIRMESGLRDGIALGIVRSPLDPVDLARALVHLLDRYCHDIAVGDPPPRPPDPDDVIDFITTLWAGILELDETVRPHTERIT